MSNLRESLLVDVAIASEQVDGIKAVPHKKGIVCTYYKKGLFPINSVKEKVIARLVEFYDCTDVNEEINSFFNANLVSNNYADEYASIRAQSLRTRNEMLIWINA